MAAVDRVGWRRGRDGADALVEREWLVTNGLGGYASGTIAGVVTRRYHAYLVAAQPSPLGRMVMLSRLAEEVRLPSGGKLGLAAQETSGGLDLSGAEHLIEFRLELGMPVWLYEAGPYTIEKRVFFAHMQNTVYVSYRLLGVEGELQLSVRPGVDFRNHEAPVQPRAPFAYRTTINDHHFELTAHEGLPPLRLAFLGSCRTFTHDPAENEIVYRSEAERGYSAQGPMFSPGRFEATLTPEHGATLVASTERWETVDAMTPAQALGFESERRMRLVKLARAEDDTTAAELALAADAFVISPAGRIADATRARAQGEELRSVIAGYHWFTDWGRDTMISLEGLTLSTGRTDEARWILRTFAHYVREGLIPNLFPEGANEGLYHTADATLWFFHAIDRYFTYTRDRGTMQLLLPVLEDIVAWHRLGTRFGIHVDPQDGLLAQGSDKHPLTWMDAKCGDWIVTPRRGKPVEINALWYNAQVLLGRWIAEERGDAAAAQLKQDAEKTRASFNAKFWNEPGQYLYDVVDSERGGPDASFRPNQIFAVSLPNPVLDRARWEPVVAQVGRRLLTPVGLRSLAPGEPDYKPSYHGDLKTRDAAYHQGTVWSWLIGPYVDAVLKLHPDRPGEARALLAGLVAHLGEACVGSISEIFDAEPPYKPRGCVAQAWGVAEVLRVWKATAG
jgi:predicted glycogen debranching enzyme